MRKLKVTTDLRYCQDGFGFDDNFNVLRYSGYRECSISLYTDYGNLSGDWDLEQACIIKNTRENRVTIKRFLTCEKYAVVSELEGVVSELDEYIGGVNYENIEELHDLVSDLGIAYTTNYLRMSTRGYSQGDYAEILINTKEFEKMAGCKFKEEDYQKWFDHYFWDSTIGGTINLSFEYTALNGINCPVEQEFEFSEYTGDEYDIDELLVGNILTDLLYLCPYKMGDKDIAELRRELEQITYNDIKYPCAC